MPQNICPVCKNLSAFPWLSKFGHKFLRCSECCHIFVQLNKSLLQQMENNYNNGTVFMENGNEHYHIADSNFMSMRLRLNWINKICSASGSLLDIGSSFGYFLKVAQEQFMAQGLDVSSYAVEWSKKNLGVNNTVASIENIPVIYKDVFDVVTMWDVIEHLPSWELAIKNIRHVLKQNGFLFLTTPDSSSLTARLMGKHWYYLDPIQHLSLFNKKNLINILKDNGFEIIGVRSLGRYYEIKYICERLIYLNSRQYFRVLIDGIKKIVKPLEEKAIYICLRDVVGICASKRGYN